MDTEGIDIELVDENEELEVNTQADFLKGDKGEKGEKGDTGDKGDKGDPGETYDDTEVKADITALQNNKVDKIPGKGLSTNDFTNTYKNNVDSNTSARHTHSNKSVLDNISSTDVTNWNNKSNFSGNYNDLTNKPTIPDTSNFITKTVNDLTNYYLKTDTYTKSEVNNLIGQISTVSIQVVQTLPQTAQTNVIYFVPKDGSAGDVYNEYIYVSNNWELIGSTQVDLTGYATETWVNTQISGFLTQTQIQTLINNALVGYAQTSDIPTNLSQLNADSTHRTVTDAEKTTWNNKSNFSGNYNDLSNKPTIPNNSNLVNGSTTGSLRSVGASGENSTYTMGTHAFAEGNFTKAKGFASHAEGDGSESQGESSHAEGYGSIAQGASSHSEGICTEATGEGSHAEGKFSTAIGSASHAEGTSTTANGDNQHVQGKNNIEDNNNKYAHIVGNGQSDENRSNAHTIDWQGNGWFQGNVKVGGTSQDDTNAQNLVTEDKYNRLKATLPTTTGEGQDVTLNKTAELEFKKPPLPRGNSEQDGEPSPDNEVPITNVTGDVEVVVGNKNLIDINNPMFRNTILRQWGSAIGVSNVSDVSQYIKVIPNTQYTLSLETADSNYRRICFYKQPLLREEEQEDNTRFINYTEYLGNTKTFATPNECNYIRVAYLNSASKVQLEKSSTATDYVEHKSQTFIFPLGNEKLMLGDYLADDGIHHVRGQVVLDGTENWLMSITSRFYITVNNIKSNLNIGMCNKFVKQTLQAQNGITFAPSNTKNIYIYYSNKTTVNDFKNWLTEQYNNNSPVIVEYELEEEVIVPYTSAQQEVYNQIKQALSYEEQTNISSNTIALFNVEAYQDAKVILAEKGTYSKPSTGIPKADLASDVQTSLNKADTALQSHQDISGKANKISVVQTSASTIEINPNTFYKFGEVASLNITLASITDNTIYNEYMFEFVSGTTATTLTLPSSIKWLETPTIDANKIYQCSIVDNVGLLVGVANV